VKPERHAPLVVGLAVVVVSFAAILIRLCTVPTAVIAAFRLALASLVLLPIFAGRARSLRVRRRDVGFCLLAGLFLSLHFLFWIESLKLTTVASSVVLVTTSPIFAAIFAWLALRESIGRKTVFAIVLCLAGGLVIGRGDFALGREVLRGNILAVLGAAAFGAQFVTGRGVRRHMDFLEYAFITYTASAVMLVGWAALRSHAFAGFPAVNYLWFALLAVGPQVFGHTSLNWALRYMPAPKVAICILGEPIGSALLAWLFFSEVPGWSLLAGAALILYGVYLTLTDRSA
jgi:drug/metabolite transporter (DMT)-like permease